SIPSRPFNPRLDYSGEHPNTISAPETEQDALMDGGFSSGSITIGLADVDVEGDCLNQVYVGLFSDGAATSWKTMGLSRNVLKFNRWGCMVVNLSMVILKPSQPGDVVKQISRIIKLRSRTVTMRHDQFNAETGEPIARSLATGMLVNLNTRRAIHFPQHVFSV
ncbi:MAG: acyl-CoA thioesterase, partial [Cyanobacteria bacterium P01_C01_bin.118]